MKQSRTHTCGELRLSDAGKQVTIVGWLENVREVGANFAFCVLRDFYGTTQFVVETEEMMRAVKPLNKETTLSVTGTVRERESKNPKLPTGEIEVVPEKIEVLGKCRHNQLPFEINKSRDADENTRLKYRFLDLRNPAVKKNIVLRCQVVAELRRLMTEQIQLWSWEGLQRRRSARGFQRQSGKGARRESCFLRERASSTLSQPLQRWIFRGTGSRCFTLMSMQESLLSTRPLSAAI